MLAYHALATKINMIQKMQLRRCKFLYFCETEKFPFTTALYEYFCLFPFELCAKYAFGARSSHCKLLGYYFRRNFDWYEQQEQGQRRNRGRRVESFRRRSLQRRLLEDVSRLEHRSARSKIAENDEKVSLEAFNWKRTIKHGYYLRHLQNMKNVTKLTSFNS